MLLPMKAMYLRVSKERKIVPLIKDMKNEVRLFSFPASWSYNPLKTKAMLKMLLKKFF